MRNLIDEIDKFDNIAKKDNFMDIILSKYLPIFIALLSVLNTMAVALIGFKINTKIEFKKTQYSYLSYKLQKLMDEYSKYDPTIHISRGKNDKYVRLVEEKYNECRVSIQKILPLIPSTSITELQKIEKYQSDIIKEQFNEKISGIPASTIEANEYTGQLVNYINFGHEILKNEIVALRNKLEN